MAGVEAEIRHVADAREIIANAILSTPGLVIDGTVETTELSAPTGRQRKDPFVTQFLFFSGKGGVGKTTMACTTGVAEADAGTRVLIVTTDPASNLADVFEQPIGHAITPIAGVPNLWAMEIDPDRATAEYTDRTLAPIREIFPPEIVRVLEEQLAGPCTAEVAAFDRFADFLDPTAPATSSAGGAAFDLVIFDTAPTGHTVRLLELPEAWSRSIAESAAGSGQTCIGPAAAIADAKVKYERALAALRDQSLTRFAFVLHPEATAIAETRRAGAELARLGIVTTELIVNGILPAEEASTPFFAARIAMQERYLAEIARLLPMPTRRVPLLDGEVRGVARLRALVPLLADEHAPRPAFGHAESRPARTTVDDDAAVRAVLLPDTGPRTIFFAGKGGVGKTVASCATAVWAARAGHRTLLVTTDPAAHIGQVLEAAVGTEPAPVAGVDGLWAARVDAKAAAVAYTDRIIADAVARGRSPASVAAMREELDSPCTEEMAAFDQFIELASRDSFDVTIFDTAPTGHTMRLLELPIDWSRQIDVKVFASVDTAAADDVAKARFGGVIEMMRDPAQSTFAFVMYPESTPIVEASRAIAELKSLGIPLGLVVANMVLPEAACRTPYARARRQMQQAYLADIEARFDAPVLEIPLLDGEVVGLERLGELLERTLAPTSLVA
jgi:arsenite-transporting ATPase